MYSPLTTMPRRIRPWRIRSLRMKTPVIIPAQALERSKAVARSAPSACLSGHAHRWLELEPQAANVAADARHDQHVEILRRTVGVGQGVSAAPSASV